MTTDFSFILLILMTLFFAFAILELRLFYKVLGLTFLAVLSLAPRAFRMPPFVLISNIGIFEMIFVALIVSWILSGRYKYVKLNIIPTKNILLIFLLCLLIANLRLYFSTEELSFKVTNIRIQMFVLSFPLVLSTVNYEKMLKRIFISIILATIVISFVTILIYLFGISIPGLKSTVCETHGRIIWGGMFIWFPFFLLVIMILMNFVTPKIRIYLYILLFIGFIALLLTQSRHLFLVALITAAVLSLRKNVILTIPKYIYLFCLMIVFTFLVGLIFTDFKLMQPAQGLVNRFTRLEKEFSAVNKIAVDPSNTWDVGRWRTLMYSVDRTESIKSFIFGHGAGFKDSHGVSYLHSGWGWMYGSMGLLGVILLIVLVAKTNNVYSKYVGRNNRIDLNSALIQLILSFLIALCITGPLVGVFIQSYNLFFNALLLGILEVCRRNIIMKKYIYLIM